jgi:hypothetical protein
LIDDVDFYGVIFLICLWMNCLTIFKLTESTLLP